MIWPIECGEQVYIEISFNKIVFLMPSNCVRIFKVNSNKITYRPNKKIKL